jgi:hypothetical protein
MNLKLKARIIEQYGAQYRFARELNVQETEITNVVHGRKELAPNELREWARLLKCKAKDLVTPEA